MTGREYLARIKAQLEAGHHQYKMGANLLAEFGYLRRRQTAIETINKELSRLGLRTEPPVTTDMPLETPRIRFFPGVTQPANTEPVAVPIATQPTDGETQEEPDEETLVSGFKVAELAAARKAVEWLKPSESLKKAYTVMTLRKYSQLVVAESGRPLATAVKGIVSYMSITNALLHGSATTVRECLDTTTPLVSTDDDVGAVINHLAEHDVVLVVGADKRLSGIITAWDLADEFGELVGPFEWIGEIEHRLRTLLDKRVGPQTVLSFLSANLTANGADSPSPNLDLLTLGELVRFMQSPDNWEKLLLPFDRVEFVKALDSVRVLRNRLMHFRDPLKEDEITEVKRFCHAVRTIPEQCDEPELGKS